MQNAIALANNDLVTIAWSYGQKPEGCMGFAVYRVDSTGKETALPSHAVFKGDTIKGGQTTEEFPVQKFYWKDPYARLVADQTGSRTFRYKIVPLEGKPGALKPMAHWPMVISNEVTVTSAISDHIHAYFNRGIISTQRVSAYFKGHPTKGPLSSLVSEEDAPLRKSLAGDMIGALTGFLDRAQKTGQIYACLYELHDKQLVDQLTSLGDRLNLVLSNAAVVDPATKEKSDGNDLARATLKTSARVVVDRIMPENHIGHNKFVVYVDHSSKPQAVLFGSTNWTPTGLCTQTNNTLVVDDPKLAQRYLDYWKQLAADCKAADGDPKQLQGTKLRTWDAKSKSFTIDDATAESWFSPNTPHQRSSNTKNEKRPPDMKDVADLIGKAKDSIIFLAFFPGTPSIANWTADAAKANKDLFVRGCVTNKSASEGFYYELRGSAPPKKVKGQKTPIKQDPRVIGAEAFDGSLIPEGWQREILAAGFAIIHDKIVVIDPFSDDCVLITGSHNLGHKASYNNDENLIIIQGNKKLAMAYACHVLDVYDHFSWRRTVKQEGPKGADQSLASDPEQWLGRYFGPKGEIKVAQLRFWLRAGAH